MPESRNGEIARLELLFAAHPEGRVFTHLAEAYRRAGDAQRAHELLENGLARHGDYPSAHVVMGRVLLDLGRTEEAGRSFRRALELDPHNLVALRALADIARSEGRTAEAMDYYRKLLELDPFDDEYADILAELHASEPAAHHALAESVDTEHQDGSQPVERELVPAGSAAVEPMDAEGDVVHVTLPGTDDLHRNPPDTQSFAPHWPEFPVEEETMAASVEAPLPAAEPGPTAPEPHDEEPAPIEGIRAGLSPAEEDAPEPDPVVVAEPEPVVPAEPEPVATAGTESAAGDDMLTETLAELYLAQGQTERAIEVYEALLRRRPGDPHLLERLGHAWAHRMPGGGEGEAVSAAPETAPEPEVAPAQAPEASSEGDVAGAGTPAHDPRPAAAPAIGSYFNGLLGWKPAIEAPSVNGRHPEPAESDAEAEALPDTVPEAFAEPDYDDPFTAPAPAAAAEIEPLDPVEAEEEVPPEVDDDLDALFTPAPVTSAVEPRPAPAAAPRPAAPTAAAVTPARSGMIGLAGVLVGLLEQSGAGGGTSGLTRELATAIGRELGLDQAALEALALAALLRGLGRIAPGGTARTDAAEAGSTPSDLAFTLELLGGIPLPESVRETLRWSAARWDGQAGPAQAGGAAPARDAIPRTARILAVADTFATLVAEDRERSVERVADALARIEEDAGRRFDPDAVAALLRVVNGHPVLGVPRRVLVVEAGPAAAAVAATRLRTSGFQPRLVPGFAVARERLAERAADALIIGGGLPAGEIESFLTELRADPAVADAPIVVTGVDDLDLRIAFLTAGADLCFPSSAAPDEVSATLAALLRRIAAAGRAGAAPAPAAAATSRPAQPAPPPVFGPVPPPYPALEGDLGEFPLSWLLRVMDYDGRTAAIHVAGATDSGVVYLENGAPIHAETGRLSGEDALRAMLGWTEGTFHLRHTFGPGQRTIHRSLIQILVRPPDE